MISREKDDIWLQDQWALVVSIVALDHSAREQTPRIVSSISIVSILGILGILT